MVGVPEILVMVFMAAFWLLALGAVVYLFSLLRGIHQSVCKLQTDVEELRRDLSRVEK